MLLLENDLINLPRANSVPVCLQTCASNGVQVSARCISVSLGNLLCSSSFSLSLLLDIHYVIFVRSELYSTHHVGRFIVVKMF